jgi:tetratricopeptide (TPR) repeat protein
MSEDEELNLSAPGEDTMLQQAIEALRTGDRARARDLLTRLLKVDQKNANYWVWLSATVDSNKERLYCLQMAIQADPENAAAKRGLILFGGLPPDDSVPPFPVNRPRLWEEQLAISKDPREKPRGWANPIMRVFMILGIGIITLGLFAGGYVLMSHKGIKYSALWTPTSSRAAVRTSTPTATPVANALSDTPTFRGPTPLWMFLDKTYTPTPLYVITEHPITSQSAFEAGLRFMAGKDYKNALVLFQQAQVLEPKAPDIDYYIGEIYRAQGSFRAARDQYQNAINKDANFAPAFLGRALVNLALNPKADVSSDLDTAINLDPKYAEAYIERGKYQLSAAPASAVSDLKKATELSPYSAEAFYILAEAQLANGENDSALASALRANQLDITIVPVYLVMAQAYIATGNSEKAVNVLQTYTVFAPNDAGAQLALGKAYNAAGEYQLAVNALNKAIAADLKNSVAYSQRGYAYLNLQKSSEAEADYKSAIIYDSSDFEAYLGLAHVYDLQNKAGDAYMEIEAKAKPLAKKDAMKAQVYYWEALYLEKIGDPLSDQGAINAWYQLIALPADVMPAEWRTIALTHLKITPTATPTRIPTHRPTSTPTLVTTELPRSTLTQTPTK